jgi:hypothetical protein
MAKQFQFDVFLCHNSKDKPAVIKIATQLQQLQIKPWLDIWELRPGVTWQPELEKQIAHIKSAAVFVGSSGFGPWQNQEIDAFLREFVHRQCPVIPVLLPDAPSFVELPVFLRGISWVDFRKDSEETALNRLIWGITGKKPLSSVFIEPPSSVFIEVESVSRYASEVESLSEYASKPAKLN